MTIPGQTAHYTVTKPTEAERILFNKGAAAGDWPTVLEKAYGLWANDKEKKGAVQKNWEVPVDYSGHAGHTDIALALLTNRPAPTLQLQDTPEEKVRQHLIDIKIDHRAVVANRARENFAADELVDLPMAHTYAIANYDPEGAGGGTVTIRNPWAGADGSYSGTFDMSLDQFMKSFKEMTEEEAKPPVTASQPTSVDDKP